METKERRLASLFGLEGDKWMRHANPVSVWTRFAILPVLALAIWTYDWIGWWSLLPTALVLVFMMVNPLLFPSPKSTRNWASKAVFGERIWADRNDIALPPHHRETKVPVVTVAFQLVGAIFMTYGLIRLDALAVVSGVLLTQLAKCWFLDRMVLLFEEMKTTKPEYASWEY
ncbi:DUF6653 family protein [Paractinoplanes rishiriensis]|uniref:Uncharacterized protein n=1 Tax=Paractinoplanes rishiriensis TaxID=1050105 RepID=A0A919K6N2_9ACTN|nr:DUF6653 family protein [Actinoplanes rishiriensis]GIF00338.1 hypothetical protein Ari01nite_78020 [Actinoplanes rishiriensis]